MLIHNPNGPYELAGHCLGGIIAFEMAKQLQVKGKKVHLLAMLDTIIRRKVKEKPVATFKNLFLLPTTINRIFERLMLKVSFQTFLLRNHTRESINYKVNNVKRILKRMKRNKRAAGDLQDVGLELFNESSEIYVNACKKYNLTPYQGDIVLFYAAEHYFFRDKLKNISFHQVPLDESTKNLWKEYAENTTIHEIKGDHSEIFSPDQGKDFAQLLQKHLDNMQQ